MPRLSPITRRVVETLLDGPRPYRSLIDELADLVQPGIAYREYESSMTRQERIRRRNGNVETPSFSRPRSDIEKVELAKRWIVGDRLRSLRRQGVIAYEADGDVSLTRVPSMYRKEGAS